MRRFHVVLLDVVALLRLGETRWPAIIKTGSTESTAVRRVTRGHLLRLITVPQSGGCVRQELWPRLRHLLEFLLIFVQSHRVFQHDSLFAASDARRRDASRQHDATLRLRNDALVEIGGLLLQQENLILGRAQLEWIVVREEILLDRSRGVELFLIVSSLVVVQGSFRVWEEGHRLRRIVRRLWIIGVGRRERGRRILRHVFVLLRSWIPRRTLVRMIISVQMHSCGHSWW